MTKGITNRIKMQELVNALNQLDFEEVTTENLQKLLPLAKIDFVNKVEEGMTDISIDDYVFTIHKDEHNYPKEWILIGNPPTKPYLLSDYVEVYLPMQEDDDGIYGCERQVEGYIRKHNADQNLWLKIEFYVD